MQFACKCFNISMMDPQQLGRDSSASSTNTGSVALAADMVQNNRLHVDQQNFFKRAIGPVDFNGSSIVVRHVELLRVSCVPESTDRTWSLHQCINCDTISHAIDASGRQLLVSPETITNERDVQYLRNNVNYSATFGILMNQTTRHLEQNSRVTRPNMDDQCQRLTESFRDAIQREIEATDERIRLYTDSQFSSLQAYREKAEQDFNALIKLAKSVPETAPGVTDSSTKGFQISANKPMLDTPPATPDSTPMSIGNSPNFQLPQTGLLTHGASTGVPHSKVVPSGGTTILNNRSVLLRRPLPNRYPTDQMAHSYGGGGVIEDAVDAFFFEMDGISARENYPISNAMSDVEESDSNESLDQTSEAISIPRSQGRPKNLSIAQSLPISMPVSSEQRPSLEDEYDEYEAVHPDDNVDIAASIKALARSVHGEAVFGDLPRPRFSTQI